MTEQEFFLNSYNSEIESGSVKWSSPSNIALVKYWGKRKNQILSAATSVDKQNSKRMWGPKRFRK